jgi:hypothetical protein
MSAKQPASLGAAAIRPIHEPVRLNWGRLTSISLILVALGVIGVVFGLASGHTQRVWSSWLVNWLYFTGIAEGGVVCSAAFYLTQARWAGTTQYRLAEAWWRFLPLAFVLFLGVFIGRNQIFPWIAHPNPKQAMWLNVPFFFARDYLALAIIVLVAWWFVTASRSRAAEEWHRRPETIEMPPKAVRRLAPAIGLLFVFIWTLFAFDLISSLSPRWHSTLFGWWYFAGVFWSNIVAMAFTAVLMRHRLPEGNVLDRGKVRHDLGKMIFAFSIFWMYLSFAQYIVIWYGDLPSETFFIITRCWHHPWMLLSWLAPFLMWVVPFFTFLGVKPKKTPIILGTVALLGLIGVWDLNYILVTPSLSPNKLPLGWIELCITAGFLGAFLLCAAPGLKLLANVAAADATGGER